MREAVLVSSCNVGCDHTYPQLTDSPSCRSSTAARGLGLLAAGILAVLVVVDLSKTAGKMNRVQLEERQELVLPRRAMGRGRVVGEARKSGLWIVPDNGVVTTINTRGFANEWVSRFHWSF